jgi:hypothetical protein
MDGLLIVAFAVLLWTPTADYFGHVDRAPAPDENRLLAPPPRLARRDIAGLQAYLAGAEAYFNDNFGFRRRLIRWNHQWKERLYRGGRSADQVIVGQNGWLFFTEGRMVEHYLGLEQLTPLQLQAWQRLLEKRRDWLAARGIKYLFVIPPDKQSVYPENLPAWLLAARRAGCQTKLDQFVQYMKAHSTLEVLDMRQALLSGKKIAPTYLQNDTHWNWHGGFIGSQEVIKALSRQMPDLPALRLEDFDWTNAPATGGDVARILGKADKPEKNYFVFTPKPPLVAPQSWQITNIIRIRNPNDPAKVNYLVENTNLSNQPVDLVVFHDSFGKAFRQFLGYSFHRIVFVWENKEFNPRVITENHPQIVINEMLERYFNIEDPDEMLATEALP